LAIHVRYSVHLTLEGHADPIFLEVSKDEHDRLMRLLQDPVGLIFALVEGIHETVAIRIDCVALANFCFDPMTLPAARPQGEESTCQIQVYLKGRQDPVSIAVDPDEPGNLEGGVEPGQLQSFLVCLEGAQGEEGLTHFLEDIDGEPWVIRERCLSMIRVPNHMLAPFEAEAPGADDDIYF
jgi:hypothetical protein